MLQNSEVFKKSQLTALKLNKCFYYVSKCLNWSERGNYLQEIQPKGLVNPVEYNITLNNLTTRFPEHLMQALVTLLEMEVLSHNI